MFFTLFRLSSSGSEEFMDVKSAIKEVTRGSMLYSPLRDTYHWAFNRSHWKQRKRMAAFFSQFVSSDDLVFDVGANVGDYTEMFIGLGARVVAIEANPHLAARLKTIRPFDRVVVESVAVGAKEGVADLYLCGRDYLATLSREWISVAETSERFSGVEWGEKRAVPVSTLDLLIRKHGVPQFIKIDVEGFEKEVLEGLTRAPRFLGFEFNSEFSEAAVACVAQKCFSPDAEFNATLGLSMEFVFDQWVGRDELTRYVRGSEVAKIKTNGDIFVRENSPRVFDVGAGS